jgi:hypothetical protein
VSILGKKAGLKLWTARVAPSARGSGLLSEEPPARTRLQNKPRLVTMPLMRIVV